MRKLMVSVMIITLVFSSYCFSSPGVVRADEGLKVATLEEGTIDEFIFFMKDAEVISEVVLSMEDGQMDIEEVENLATILQEKMGINPDWDSYYCAYHVLRAFIYIITLQFDLFQYHLGEALIYCALGI